MNFAGSNLFEINNKSLKISLIDEIIVSTDLDFLFLKLENYIKYISSIILFASSKCNIVPFYGKSSKIN